MGKEEKEVSRDVTSFLTKYGITLHTLSSTGEPPTSHEVQPSFLLVPILVPDTQDILYFCRLESMKKIFSINTGCDC